MRLILAALAALFFTLGGIFMKRADGLQHRPAVAGFLLLFAVGAALQSLAMRGTDLGTTYIVVLGLEAALALAFGTFLFGETFTVPKAIAVLAIVGGVALLRST